MNTRFNALRALARFGAAFFAAASLVSPVSAGLGNKLGITPVVAERNIVQVSSANPPGWHIHPGLCLAPGKVLDQRPGQSPPNAALKPGQGF
jgi:hypothetical protein